MLTMASLARVQFEEPIEFQTNIYEPLNLGAFLGALAKRGASNSLILLEGEQQGKTSAFLLFEYFGFFLESFGFFWNLLDSFGIF